MNKVEFKKALPIWLKDMEREYNVQARFVTVFAGEENMKLLVTGAAFYKILLNGKLLHYGPAPAAAGYVRVDEVPLEAAEGENRLEIEVAGYYCNSYERLKQPSFIRAEVFAADRVVAATGFDFQGYRVNSRLQKTFRYSFQRAFSEAWDLHRKDTPAELAVQEMDCIGLKRKAPLADLEVEIPAVICKDVFTYGEIPAEKPSFQGAIDRVGGSIDGYPYEEIEENTWDQFTVLRYEITDKPEKFPLELSKDEFAVFGAGRSTAGLIRLKYRATEGTRILIAYDEKLIDGRFLYEEWESMNLITVRASGEVDFTNFVIGAFKYWAVYVLEGSLVLEESSLIKCRNNCGPVPALQCEDKELVDIYEAAVESFKCNSLGILMDCPSRERAGWLLDSYYSAQAEYALTGKTLVEDDFLENMMLFSNAYDLAGVLTGCYPADFNDTGFACVHSMWYLLELEQYVVRNPERKIEEFKELVLDVIKDLKQFENEDGLLENLPGCFIEWSDANDYTNGVSFPVNMLYGKALELVGTWYGEQTLLDRAEQVRKNVREMAYDGRFFRDHAVRDAQGQLVQGEEISEICQHFAFRFGTVTPESYPELYRILLEDLGFCAEKWGLAKMNVIIGLYMRMEMLCAWGETDRLLKEIKAICGPMAEMTGTLWEHWYRCGSLNHGFASYVAAALLNVFNK